jgi:hypothetical protein
VAKLLRELPIDVPGNIIDKAKVLDNFYVPTRYANGHPEGPPFEHYGTLQSEDAIRYARREWGVGSDLDLIAIVNESPEAFERRSLSWSLTCLPVPSDLLIYTQAEWESLQQRGGRFASTLSREAVWVYVRSDHVNLRTQ